MTKGRENSNTITVGGFHVNFTLNEGENIQKKTSNKTEDFSNILDKANLIEINRMFHKTAVVYKFFSYETSSERISR